MSRAFWRRLRRQDDAGVSFTWPRDTDLTAEQIRIAMRESAASPSQPEAGRPVETTAHDAPPPQTVRLLVGVPAEAVEALMMDPPPGVVSVTPYDALSAEEQAEWREAYHAPPPQQWQPGPTPVLGGVVGEVDPEPGGTWTKVSSDGPRVWGEGVQGPAAMLDYADSLLELRELQGRDWREGPTPLLADVTAEPYGHGKTLVYGDDPQAHGIAASPGAAMRDYADCSTDLRILRAACRGELHKPRNPDVPSDTKADIRRQLAACCGDCGDGPPCYEEWAR